MQPRNFWETYLQNSTPGRILHAMKIIQVVNVRFYNATAWYGLFLSKLLIEAGHEVRVIGLKDTESFKVAQTWGLPITAMDLNTQTPWGLLRLFRDLKKLLRTFSPDIVNCHRGEGFILWGILRKTMGSFRLVRTRGDQRLPKTNIANRLLHAHIADAVISTNSRMTRHFQETFALGKDRLFQIIGGVDRARFRFDPAGRKKIRRELGYTDADIVVGLLGRFDLVKGQKETIEAIASIYRRSDCRHVRLMLLGFETDTREAQVRQWIQDNGIQDITHITGKCQDVTAYISALDLGIVSSLWSETIARAALEIMSCEIPLLGTTVGVMPDLLQPEALIPPGDVTALGERIASVITDTASRNLIHEQQRQRMQTLGDQDFLKQTMAVYRELHP